MTAEQDVWLPKGHVERLTVGARVRIRLSPECDLMPPPDGTQYDSVDYHVHAVDGAVGTIMAVNIGILHYAAREAIATDSDHHYRIKFDNWFKMGDGWKFNSGSFTATELIPIDDADEVQS